MEIELSFLSIIDILSIATTFMLGLLFLTIKSNNKKANMFLGLFLWSLGFEVFNAFLHSSTDEVLFVFITSLFTIPFLLLYVLTTINFKIKSWVYLVFVLGLIANFFNSFENFKYLEYVLNITILFYILFLLKRHKKQINSFYSDLEHKTLQWILLIVFIFLAFHLFWIIEDIVSFQNEDYKEYFASISTVGTLFMIYWIGYNGFSQSEIFRQKLFTNFLKDEFLDITSETSLKKFESLKHIIETEKLFINTNLNLRGLSESLQIKEKELSKLINIHSKTNFYQFINSYRVNEFKILLNSSKAKQLSILGLALEAGFSSKSTFYTAFKSIEGMTPKQYEKSLKESE